MQHSNSEKVFYADSVNIRVKYSLPKFLISKKLSTRINCSQHRFCLAWLNLFLWWGFKVCYTNQLCKWVQVQSEMDWPCSCTYITEWSSSPENTLGGSVEESSWMTDIQLLLCILVKTTQGGHYPMLQC